MERLLKSKVDEIKELVKGLDYIQNLARSSSIILEKYSSLEEIKKDNDSYLINEFRNDLSSANELSNLLSSIFKNELEIK